MKCTWRLIATQLDNQLASPTADAKFIGQSLKANSDWLKASVADFYMCTYVHLMKKCVYTPYVGLTSFFRTLFIVLGDLISNIAPEASSSCTFVQF
nr:hypothetical protein HmN_000831600 [Hymenolepis microstoma]